MIAAMDAHLKAKRAQRESSATIASASGPPVSLIMRREQNGRWEIARGAFGFVTPLAQALA